MKCVIWCSDGKTYKCSACWKVTPCSLLKNFERSSKLVTTIVRLDALGAIETSVNIHHTVKQSSNYLSFWANHTLSSIVKHNVKFASMEPVPWYCQLWLIKLFHWGFNCWL